MKKPPRISPCTTRLAALVMGAALLAHAAPTQAHGVSDASAASLALPVAVSVTAPLAVLSAGAALAVVSVEAGVDGTTWLLERAADGTRATLRLSGHAAGAASVAAGQVVVVTVVAAGWILSAAGQAIAFVPNAVGHALLHDQRVTR